MTQKVDVLVIGGGVIGVCAAYYLSKMGREVTLIESGEIGSGCSYGNAGLIVPGHSIPLAAPGVLLQGLKWMFDPTSPFYIRPRFDLSLMSWLARFGFASREKQMRRGLTALKEIGYASLDLFERLIQQEELTCSYHKPGWLMIYRTQEGFKHGVQDAELLKRNGVEVNVLDAQEAYQVEPAIKSGLVGGVYFPNEAYIDPFKFVQQLAGKLKEIGTNILTNTEVVGFEKNGDRIKVVRTNRGDFEASQILLAAGSWSVDLARSIDINIPIQPAKGYSVTFPIQDESPKVPLHLHEAKVAVTPLEGSLRLAGTLELTGMNLQINHRRVKTILDQAQAFLHLPQEAFTVEPWAGLRPCTPDGLPIISQAGGLDNFYVAAGHCMLGVTLAPITGKLIAQLLSGKSMDIDLAPFDIKRF